MALTFKIASSPKELPKIGNSEAWLLRDNWDDWGAYETLYHLFVFNRAGEQRRIGDVKIGRRGLIGGPRDLKNIREGVRYPSPPVEFGELPAEFFSIGQDASYYQELMALEADMRHDILKGLRDVVADDEIWKAARNEEVLRISLLRSVTPKTVEGQFRRILKGSALVTPFSLIYTPADKFPSRADGGIQFSVVPDSQPPTNLHVIIGRNGVGKSYTLHHMTRALLGDASAAAVHGSFDAGIVSEPQPIANLVSVSFSAFDTFEHLSRATPETGALRYHYIGLKTPNGASKSPLDLEEEFVKSVEECEREPRLTRWQKTLTPLQIDPLFAEAGILDLLTAPSSQSPATSALKLFKEMSSGHKAILLTLTRLVETVEEKSLVLFDEPESHLHPPLLSAFIRAISDLLTDRNAVAIIATHSPVVLQEVPKRCVWLLNRSGQLSDAMRPEIETFGENVGTLTREVFKLEVMRSGFQTLLEDVASKSDSLQEALSQFQDQLGTEARASLRAIFATRGQTNL